MYKELFMNEKWEHWEFYHGITARLGTLAKQSPVKQINKSRSHQEFSEGKNDPWESNETKSKSHEELKKIHTISIK